ncbi:MAG: NrtA/SsuA/CpmA family ABC transporter substrate-binding protein [Candidatus Adiutrix sp.]|jgi:NitT/TauT family transport system substrate-binding protein/sulfonate transport system substrate-binding protein|nr:NrtA/SsuA/CpmA family ABC transporter substrate-binding protein [Candidatus Adiutrix sp.]
MKPVITLAALLALLGAASAPATEVVNISYVKSPFNLQMIVMKDQALLEKELALLGVTVNWPEINIGARQAQALATGDLDVGGVMNTSSIIMAKGEGYPVKIIAGVARPSDVFALVAKKGGAASVGDLKGKTVAGPKGTVLHNLLAAALQKDGLRLADVNFVSMDIHQSFAALQSGRVDAALLAANAVIMAEKDGAKVLTTATGLVEPKLVMAASENFIARHPDRLKAVIAAHDKAWQWIVENHQDALALGAKVQGLSLAEAEQLFAWSHFTQRLNASDIPGMEADLLFMLENDIMRNQVDIRDLILPQALEE